MIYELLIIAEGPNRGRIVHSQPVPATWGRKEGPPRFAIVAVDLPVNASLADCLWDFDDRKLIGSPLPKQRNQSSNEIAVVVSCHEAYLDWLPECLDSINAHTVAHTGYLTVYQTDGTTEVARKALTTSSAAAPITGVS